MSRLSLALEQLRLSGYDVIAAEVLSGGINSSVYLLTDARRQHYVLKLYPIPSAYDHRNRCRSEVDFLQYVGKCHSTNCPKLIESDLAKGWTLISWINGEKLESLTNSQLKQIVDFIYSINQPVFDSIRIKLNRASDSYQSLEGAINSIQQRISDFSSINISSGVSGLAIRWINHTIQPFFQELISEKSNHINQNVCFRDTGRTLIASPSDFGIHNMLRLQEKIYFFDFEYSGLDDIAKLLADFILQPNYPLNPDQENFFLESVSAKFAHTLDTHWLSRFQLLKPLFTVKWSLIMLNQLKTGTLDESQLVKAKLYFQRNKCTYS